MPLTEESNCRCMYMWNINGFILKKKNLKWVMVWIYSHQYCVWLLSVWQIWSRYKIHPNILHWCRQTPTFPGDSLSVGLNHPKGKQGVQVTQRSPKQSKESPQKFCWCGLQPWHGGPGATCLLCIKQHAHHHAAVFTRHFVGHLAVRKFHWSVSGK